MDPRIAIDYQRGLAMLGDASYETLVTALRDGLPQAWLSRYEQMCVGPTNVLVVPAEGFEYLFDYSTELIARGLLPASPGREDRVVVAFGRSVRASAGRPASRIAGFPGSDDRGDRGHFLAHAAGGGVDINLFHQELQLNRGRSPEGRLYRKMERYCATHPGTFCFSRPIYADGSARPAEIEFGVLRADGTFWVGVFDNQA
ncbi:MAG TPA: hypothetical protein VF713_00300 [Thermoanaerobaculia bacterium]